MKHSYQENEAIYMKPYNCVLNKGSHSEMFRQRYNERFNNDRIFDISARSNNSEVFQSRSFDSGRNNYSYNYIDDNRIIPVPKKQSKKTSKKTVDSIRGVRPQTITFEDLPNPYYDYYGQDVIEPSRTESIQPPPPTYVYLNPEQQDFVNRLSTSSIQLSDIQVDTEELTRSLTNATSSRFVPNSDSHTVGEMHYW